VIRRFLWVLGIAFLYLIMLSKGGYENTAQRNTTLLVGAISGLLLSWAAEKPMTLRDAKRRLLYWPFALVTFWTFPPILFWHNHGNDKWMIFSAAEVSGVVGLLFGIAHFAVASRRIRNAETTTPSE